MLFGVSHSGVCNTCVPSHLPSVSVSFQNDSFVLCGSILTKKAKEEVETEIFNQFSSISQAIFEIMRQNINPLFREFQLQHGQTGMAALCSYFKLKSLFFSETVATSSNRLHLFKGLFGASQHRCT